MLQIKAGSRCRPVHAAEWPQDFFFQCISDLCAADATLNTGRKPAEAAAKKQVKLGLPCFLPGFLVTTKRALFLESPEPLVVPLPGGHGQGNLNVNAS